MVSKHKTEITFTPPVHMRPDGPISNVDDKLLETSLFIDTLTTLEQAAVVKSAFCSIKPNVTAVRAREAMMMSTSLVPTAESSRESRNKNVEKQRRFFSTKRRAAAAFSNTLAKPSNDERKKIQLDLLKTNLITSSIAGGCFMSMNCRYRRALICHSYSF